MGTLALVIAGNLACSSEETPADAGSPSDSGSADLGGLDLGIGDNGVFDLGPGDSGGADSGLGEDAASADATSPDTGELDAGVTDSGAPDTGVVEAFTLTSPAFAMGGVIPDRHACAGMDLQPELSWVGVPAGTQSLALVLIDDSINFVHWVALNLPPTLTNLPEGASDQGQLPAGAVEVDAYCTQYCGPCPGNMHTYTFRIYALDVATISYNWPGVVRATHLNAAFGTHTLAEARLTGTFTP